MHTFRKISTIFLTEIRVRISCTASAPKTHFLCLLVDPMKTKCTQRLGEQEQNHFTNCTQLWCMILEWNASLISNNNSFPLLTNEPFGIASLHLPLQFYFHWNASIAVAQLCSALILLTSHFARPRTYSFTNRQFNVIIRQTSCSGCRPQTSACEIISLFLWIHQLILLKSLKANVGAGNRLRT